MIPSAIIDALVGAGATPEMIAAAFKADQALTQERLDKRRTRDAERQRRKRLRDIAKSRHVTRTHADIS
jgi:fructose-1,6-bisphosphatase/sedoheptulose 1,7-bisphosphatase-like protein